MDFNQWSTKEDIRNDLAALTGNSADIDESYIVYGERPPRTLMDNDIDIEVMFGQEMTLTKGPDMNTAGPDLRGITNMIRQVQSYETDDNDYTTPDDIVVISKLNPNVKEFVPKYLMNNVSSQPSVHSDNTSVSNIADYKINDSNNKGKTDSEQATDKQIIEKLKEKIKTSGSDSFSKKIERNAAINNLLRLHSKEPAETVTKPVKLYPPDFFEKHTSKEYGRETPDALPKHEKEDDHVRLNDTVSSVPSNEPVQTDFIDEHTQLTPDLDDGLNLDEQNSADEQLNVLVNDEEIVASTARVNDWFEYQPKVVKAQIKRNPEDYLNAIKYKRKEPKSPIGVVDKKIYKTAAYVPSAYASELLKKYSENSKKINEKQFLNVWDKLEADLKRKDEEIRQRKLAARRGDSDRQLE